MENARPVIFYRRGCSRSTRALYYLRTRAVAHDQVEVKEGTPAFDQLREATSQTATPAFVFDRDFIHRFEVAELAAFLQKHHLDPTAPR